MKQVIQSSTIYSNTGKAYTFNLCKLYDYYFTVDGVKLDWTFPLVCKGSAVWHYNNILANRDDDVQWIIDWALEEH